MGSLLKNRKQLPWLALLAVAVILPTASLLWFMSRVIANERLAVQEKLRVLYRDKLADANRQTGQRFGNWLESLNQIDSVASPYAAFARLVLQENIQGVVIWDLQNSLFYPKSSSALEAEADVSGALAEAWQAEFARQDYEAAATLYASFSRDYDSYLAITAMTGRARCLSKLGRRDEAIAECSKAAFASFADTATAALNLKIANARLLLLSLLRNAPQSPQNVETFQRTIRELLNDLYSANPKHPALPANQNIFIAKKVLEALNGKWPLKDAQEKQRLEQLVAAEELSMSAAESLRPSLGQFDALFQTRQGETRLYGLRHRSETATVLILIDGSGLAAALEGYAEAFANTEASYRILDAAGEFVAGNKAPQGASFNSAPLPLGFPGWKAELFFEGGDVFEKAASRQIAVYTWTGFLVILLILVVSGFAMRAVGRQIRLNEMKNDFIATVSHELKTPLASMRVLVETLLEGNIKDEAQARRYLQLTARENERLSRMIDNFLTFSRMERNKVAFTLTDAKPGLIASDAIEAVKTKYENNNCRFESLIPPNLPEIHADHDAIVTVLVNLLDNACKYTGEDKQVKLEIRAETDTVVFAVADNGIGLNRRHLRKIFDRFYQVDSSLARRAEGCGLGLSIVKFIVDAHHGKITVDSRPEKGSTFTVWIPVARPNGNH